MTRFMLVTATLPAPLFDRLQADFPGLAAALGPGLHRSAPGALPPAHAERRSGLECERSRQLCYLYL